MASIRAFFRTQNPSKFLKPLNLINPSFESDFVSSIFHQRLNLYPISLRPFSSLAEFEQINNPELEKLDNGERESIKKKPLGVFFKEAVGVVEKNEDVEEDLEGENGELKKRLKKLEDEVRSLKEQSEIERLKMKEKSEMKIGGLNMEGGEDGEVEESVKEPKRKSLSELFAGEEKKDSENWRKVDPRMEDPGEYRELSPDMIMFVTHLYKQGYFRNTNLLPRNKFAIGCFETGYARDFVKFTAQKFGNDNQKIAKWLSASDLKKVALFGCPSLAKRNVFYAKRLRVFFKIQENTVCDRCVLKKSCQFANEDFSKGDHNALNLGFTMRLLTLYALESVSPELVVTAEIKSSVGRLLKEAVNLSKPVKKAL